MRTLRLLLWLAPLAAHAQTATYTNPMWSVSQGGTDWSGQGCLNGNWPGWIWGYVTKDAQGVFHIKMDYCDAASSKWQTLTFDNAGPRFADAETPIGALDGKNAAFTLAHTPQGGARCRSFRSTGCYSKQAAITRWPGRRSPLRALRKRAMRWRCGIAIEEVLTPLLASTRAHPSRRVRGAGGLFSRLWLLGPAARQLIHGDASSSASYSYSFKNENSGAQPRHINFRMQPLFPSSSRTPIQRRVSASRKAGFSGR